MFGKARQTAKVTIGNLSGGWQETTVQQALDEIARELGVRERLYVKWVEEGKHSETEARDKLRRMIKAASILQALVDDSGLWMAVQSQLEETIGPASDGEPANPVPAGPATPF